MKQTINESQFIDAFTKLRPNNFSYESLSALYDHLEQYEDETEKELELDVIAICCDYSEYDNLKEVQDNYNDIETLEDLRNNTTVIEIPNSEKLIIQAY